MRMNGSIILILGPFVYGDIIRKEKYYISSAKIKDQENCKGPTHMFQKLMISGFNVSLINSKG